MHFLQLRLLQAYNSIRNRLPPRVHSNCQFNHHTLKITVMKKLVLLLVLVHTAIFTFSQNNKWFISLSSNRNFGGPAGSFKKQINSQGFNGVSESNIFGLRFTTQYPIADKLPNLVLHGGRKLKGNKSLYFIAGIVDAANVEGYKRTGYQDMGIIGGSVGKRVSITSNLYQVSVGYMYSGNSRVKWGIAPSLFLLNYNIMNDSLSSQGTAVTGGITFTGRLPLGRERRLVGVDLYTELNLAPPVKPHASRSDAKDFNPGAANLVYGSIGLALSFRR